MPKPARSHELLRRFSGGHRSPRTAKAYGAIAAAFLSFIGRRAPTRRDAELFLARPLRSGARASVATYNQVLAALRCLARLAVHEEVWDADPTAGLTFLREPDREPPVLLIHEVQDFFRAVNHVSAPNDRSRDLAILALLFAVGLRVSELTGLDEAQVDLESATLLGVVRKGGRVQNLPIESSALQLLRCWLTDRARVARGGDHSLFVSRLGSRLSARSVQRLFERLRTHVGTRKRATPHTARHSFITLDLSMGADITVVSRLAGHASVATTMRYRHLLDSEPRAAVARLGVVIPSELVAVVADPSGLQSRVVSRRVAEGWTRNVTPSNDSVDAHGLLGDIA